MNRILPLAALLATCFAASATAADQTLIVLDGSGSMWGQIDGRPKLEIARETLGRVLAELPADAEVGLVAYGHRQKGACDDIEVVVPARAGSAADIRQAAERMKFLGMTPISEAVTVAARELRHTERKATVILVTDGLETCKADPCSVGKALEESGVDFTAHVVGFGLSAEEGKQVACLAENTGGRYFAADDADSLAAALTDTVVEVPPAPPAPDASLEAQDQVAAASTFVGTWSGPGKRFDDVQVFQAGSADDVGAILHRQRVDSDPGFARRQVSLVAPANPGDYQLRYYHGEQRRVIATRALRVVEAEVSLAAPEQVPAAARFDVGWTGPGARFDEVQVFDPAARGGAGAQIDSQRVQSAPNAAGRLVTLVAPATPGDYQLRYYNGDNREVMATRPLRVVATVVTMEAAATVPAASRVIVRWSGPGARFDEIRLWDPRGRNGQGTPVDSQRVRPEADPSRQQATVVAPAVPGDYELQYYNGDNRTVLATRPLTVTAIVVALSAPERAAAGSRLPVRWSGPGGRFDEVQLHDPAARNGEGMLLVRRRVDAKAGAGDGTVELALPAAPGRYELRYYNGDNRVVLATRPLQVD